MAVVDDRKETDAPTVLDRPEVPGLAGLGSRHSRRVERPGFVPGDRRDFGIARHFSSLREGSRISRSAREIYPECRAVTDGAVDADGAAVALHDRPAEVEADAETALSFEIGRA